MKRGLIFINGFSLTQSQKHQTDKISHALIGLGVDVKIIKGNSLPAYIDGEKVILDAPECDFAVFLDKDVHLSHMLEKSGIRLFNTAQAIEICDDKMRTYINLVGKGVKMPLTISSPLMYRQCDDDFINSVEKKIPYPIVVKECYGSFGAGVHLAENREQLKTLREKLKLIPHLYQRFVGEGGKDTRVIVIGGKVLAAIDRINENDFRSNIELGGKGYKRESDEKLVDICEKTATALGLDYCGIDLLKEGDEYYVCEVNSNACFCSFEQVTGIDAGKEYARYIYKKIYND